MTTRKWIIEKGHRTCNNHRCNWYGDSTHKGKVTLNPVTGAIGTFCENCKQTSLYDARSWKEMRACIRCQHVRNVTVTKWSGGEEHARDTCDACDMIHSARVHRHTAMQLEAKAQAIIAKRRS